MLTTLVSAAADSKAGMLNIKVRIIFKQNRRKKRLISFIMEASHALAMKGISRTQTGHLHETHHIRNADFSSQNGELADQVPVRDSGLPQLIQLTKFSGCGTEAAQC